MNADAGSAILLPRRFEAIRLLNVGGMAQVYLCKQKGSEGFEKLVAIKRILPAYAGSEKFIRMFTREAKLAALLDHNNICRVHDFIKYMNEYLLIMEFVNGVTLRDLIKKLQAEGTTLALPLCLGIMEQVCKALHYAHSLQDGKGNPLGLVHRDVTPNNIMITHKGAVKLMDFGIAKIESLPTGATVSGEIKGKIGYLSPEQITGDTLDARSDIFSLGVVFYELLTSQRLFKGDSEFSVLYRIKEAQVPPISQVIPNIDDRLAAVVMKCLAKERENRYQDVGELLEDLHAYMFQRRLVFAESELAQVITGLFGSQAFAADGRMIDITHDLDVSDVFEPNHTEADDVLIDKHIKDIEKSSRTMKSVLVTILVCLIIGGGAFLLYQNRERVVQFLSFINTPDTEKQPPAYLFQPVVPDGYTLVPDDTLPKEGPSFRVPAAAQTPFRLTLVAEADEPLAFYATLSAPTGVLQCNPPGALHATPDDGFDFIHFDKSKMALIATIRSSPEAALVYHEKKQLGKTPYALDMGDRDSYTLSLRKKGYVTRSIKLSRANLLAKGVPLFSLKKQIPQATIVVASEYKVKLYLNGKYKGTYSGKKGITVTAGRQHIKLKGANVFFFFNKTYTLKQDETITVNTPGFGFVDIKAAPSKCRIKIDGIELNEEPPIFNKRISRGSHTIQVFWDQCGESRESRFEIFQGERKILPMFVGCR